MELRIGAEIRRRRQLKRSAFNLHGRQSGRRILEPERSGTGLDKRRRGKRHEIGRIIGIGVDHVVDSLRERYGGSEISVVGMFFAEPFGHQTGLRGAAFAVRKFPRVPHQLRDQTAAAALTVDRFGHRIEHNRHRRRETDDMPKAIGGISGAFHIAQRVAHGIDRHAVDAPEHAGRPADTFGVVVFKQLRSRHPCRENPVFRRAEMGRLVILVVLTFPDDEAFVYGRGLKRKPRIEFVGVQRDIVGFEIDCGKAGRRGILRQERAFDALAAANRVGGDISGIRPDIAPARDFLRTRPDVDERIGFRCVEIYFRRVRKLRRSGRFRSCRELHPAAGDHDRSGGRNEPIDLKRSLAGFMDTRRRIVHALEINHAFDSCRPSRRNADGDVITVKHHISQIPVAPGRRIDKERTSFNENADIRTGRTDHAQTPASGLREGSAIVQTVDHRRAVRRRHIEIRKRAEIIGRHHGRIVEGADKIES